MWMNINTANVPTSNIPIWIQNDIQSIIQNPVSELEQLRKKTVIKVTL